MLTINIASNNANNAFVNQNQNGNLNMYGNNSPNNLNYMNQNNNYPNIDKINNIDLTETKYINSNSTNYNNNINSNNKISNIMIPNSILSRNSDYQEFLNYVNDLNIPLMKFLCTKNLVIILFKKS